MDKQMFLNILEKKLFEHHLSKEDVEKHVSDMEKFLATVSDEEFAKEDPTEEEIAEIALNVVRRAEQSAGVAEMSESAVAEESEVIEEPEVADEPVVIEEPVAFEEPEAAEEAEAEPEVIEDIKETQDVLELLAKEAEEERKDKETYEELKRLAIERAIAEQDEIIVNLTEEASAEANDPIEAIVDPEQRPDIAFEESESIKAEAKKPEEAAEQEEKTEKLEETKENKPFEKEEATYTISDANDFYVEDDEIVPAEENGDEYELKPVKRKKKREKVKGSPLFWVLFILTLPITVPILLSLAALFGVAYIAVTAVIVAFSVAMIGCVAAGTAIALIGIIYGAIECINVPVLGAFEIGLGVAVGGATILVSVLLYNIAIRFTPMLYKCLARFAKFLTEKIVDLYYIIKKECSKK